MLLLMPEHKSSKSDIKLDALPTHIPHLVASGGQGGDEALPLVIVHPGQCLALLAHHAEVDLGIRKNI